jgi:hypothetical protein
VNQLLNQPTVHLASRAHYHRLRRKRRITQSLKEIARLAAQLNDQMAASDGGAPDAMVDHLSTAALSLNACRLLLERRGRSV